MPAQACICDGRTKLTTVHVCLRCTITGGTGPDGLVQAAPLWDVDDEDGTITLVHVTTLAEPVWMPA